MANFNGVNAQLRANTPSEKIEASDQGGRLRVHYDEITLAAELTAADTITMGAPIPEGARIHEAILHSPQLGSAGGNGELDFGYSGDPNAFLNQVEVGSAAAQARMSDDLTLAGNGFKTTGELQPLITANETTDAGIGDTIRTWLYYSLD